MDQSDRDGQRGREKLLAKLGLEDKISLLTGADYWSLRGHPGIGLRPIRTSDGPAGVRGPRWDERDTALNVPAPVALAATWDPRRAELIGSLLAAECRRKDVDALLAPTVNLQRSPCGGRNFEFFGEDPVLTAAMAARWSAVSSGAAWPPRSSTSSPTTQKRSGSPSTPGSASGPCASR